MQAMKTEYPTWDAPGSDASAPTTRDRRGLSVQLRTLDYAAGASLMAPGSQAPVQRNEDDSDAWDSGFVVPDAGSNGILSPDVLGGYELHERTEQSACDLDGYETEMVGELARQLTDYMIDWRAHRNERTEDAIAFGEMVVVWIDDSVGRWPNLHNDHLYAALRAELPPETLGLLTDLGSFMLSNQQRIGELAILLRDLDVTTALERHTFRLVGESGGSLSFNTGVVGLSLGSEVFSVQYEGPNGSASYTLDCYTAGMSAGPSFDLIAGLFEDLPEPLRRVLLDAGGTINLSATTYAEVERFVPLHEDFFGGGLAIFSGDANVRVFGAGNLASGRLVTFQNFSQAITFEVSDSVVAVLEDGRPVSDLIGSFDAGIVPDQFSAGASIGVSGGYCDGDMLAADYDRGEAERIDTDRESRWERLVVPAFIGFETGSAELSDDAFATLDRMTGIVRRRYEDETRCTGQTREVRYVVTGRASLQDRDADNDARRDRNQELSEQRADVVEAYLNGITDGLPVTIDASAQGDQGHARREGVDEDPEAEETYSEEGEDRNIGRERSTSVIVEWRLVHDMVRHHEAYDRGVRITAGGGPEVTP